MSHEDDWAAQFICPNCGRCNIAMVTTKKTCLCCDAGLIRWAADQPHPSENAASRSFDHLPICRVSNR